MKVVKFLAAVFMAGLLSSHVIAQVPNPPSGTLISPNLLSICSQPTTSGVCGNNWTNTNPYTGTGGGTSGGSTPGYNSSTNTIYFGYQQATVANTYAFSTALQNSGMSILGYNYSWQYLNQDMSKGNLSAAVKFNGTDGTSLHTKNWTLGPTTEWTTVKGTETFTAPGFLASQIASLSLSFSGKDSRFWAGYYGPQVKDPSLTLNYTFDQCVTNPLSSPDCPGYAAAYLTQQCTANPLYNTACPGYAAAYQTQQCTINPLSDPTCPGYATAYLNQQCSVNPLYSTTCSGYETAYFNQQCSINPLYNSRCDGYAAAYKTQQCTTNPLYDTTCTGYAQAYLDAQCIKDSLFSKECKGYATAYAIKYLVPLDSSVTTAVNSSLSNTAAVKANDPTNTVVTTTAASTTINTDGTVSTGVSKTGDTNVDKAISAPPPTANSAAAPAAPVQLAPPPPAAGTQQAQRSEKKEEPSGERPARKEDGPAGATQMAQSPQGGDSKPAQPTTREALVERRQAAARAEAVERGKNLANEMGKVADMESQKQMQNVVIQAMGFTPGFDAYGKATLPDGNGYRPFTVYNNQKNIENRATLRMFSGTDRLHNEMVDSQYKEK